MPNKVLLICPSNLCYMPYAQHYLNILNEYGVEYEILYWDRFNLLENNNYLRYNDKKIGHRRTFIDYLSFSWFVRKACKSRKYKKVILFGLQLAFFLSDFMRKNYYGKYILDIRDYHPVSRLFNLSDFIRSAGFVVISSPGFLCWLPKAPNYMVCHNLTSTEQSNTTPLDLISEKPLTISF